jgi:iron complex outermembrane recepter protein
LKYLLTLFLVGFGCFGANAQTCAIRFSGHVDDLDTKEKLANASVSLLELGRTILTNRDGDFVFENICPGPYTLRITHVRCDTFQQAITLNQSLHRDFALPHAKNTLGEVVVTAPAGRRLGGIRDDVSGRELEETRGQTLAEALSRMAGVTMLQTGSTISKPVIHGLHGNRVLILNNGVRQEGQQWGSEHAPEIDPFIANRLTVVKGASSIRYGSDAIGGAILVEPRPLPTAQQTAAEINSIYFSNNRQYVLNGVVEQNIKSLPALSWRLQGTYKRGGNTRTPDYWLNNTGLQELNYSATARLGLARYQSELFFSSFHTTLGIFTGAHIGNLSDLQTAIQSKMPLQNIDRFSYEIGRPKQEVQHYLVKWNNSFLLSNSRRFNVVLAHQENFRKEFDRALITDRPELDLNIGTTTIDVNLERPGSLLTTVGVFGMRQQNVWSGSRFFVPNFVLWNASAYAIARRKLGAKTGGELGLRYDVRTLETFRNQNNQVSSINRNFHNFSGSGMIDFRPSQRFSALLTASAAWRAPQVNELYVNGLHHGTANFEIGDPDLGSEVAYNLSSQLKYNSDSTWIVDVTGYTKYINGYINLVPSLPPTLTLRGAYPTFRYMQTDALFSGADVSVTHIFSTHLQAMAKAALLWACDLDQQDWLQQIPSHRLEGELTYAFSQFHPSENYVSLNFNHVMRQNRVPANSEDYLPPPPAYTLVNLEFATLFHFLENRLNFGAGIRNLFNQRYRDYMNRFRYFNDEAGRNVVLRLKYRL